MSVWIGALQSKRQEANLCPGSCRAPVHLDESGRGYRVAKKNKPIMTYRSWQNIVLIGSFFLLLDILFLRPLVEKWGAVDRVDRLPQLNAPTVAAATNVKVGPIRRLGCITVLTVGFSEGETRRLHDSGEGARAWVSTRRSGSVPLTPD